MPFFKAPLFVRTKTKMAVVVRNMSQTKSRSRDLPLPVMVMGALICLVVWGYQVRQGFGLVQAHSAHQEPAVSRVAFRHQIPFQKEKNEMPADKSSSLRVEPQDESDETLADDNPCRASWWYNNVTLQSDLRQWSSNYRSRASTVVFLGAKSSLGRFNNQLLTILHALDSIYDNYGELSSPRNVTAVLAVSGWAAKLLENCLGLDWVRKIQQVAPIIAAHPREGRKWSPYAAKDTVRDITKKHYYYRNRLKGERLETIQTRRQRFLAVLFGDSHHCEGVKFLHERLQINNYIAIHMRSLEGACVEVLPPVMHQECSISPQYLKLLMHNNPTNKKWDDLPIVVISDMQNVSLIDSLQQEFGSDRIVVPAWMNFNATVQQDMLLAASSQVFVGTRASTMTVIISELRVVTLQREPDTNWVFVRPEDWKACPECPFLCNEINRKHQICGNFNIMG
jgi:hypothetical protein